MRERQQPKKAIVIGCGISGASAARELTKAGFDVTVLEKENRIGGKLEWDPKLSVEIGGVIVLACNYPAIDTIAKHNIKIDETLPSNPKTIDQILYQTNQPTLWEKGKFAVKLSWQALQFAKDVWSYRVVGNDEFTRISLAQYLEQNNFTELSKIMELWIPGMGYGTFAHNPLNKAMNYLGCMTIPSLMMATFTGKYYFSIHDGFKTVVEKMVEGIQVETSIQIQSIKRENNKVTVNDKNNKTWEANLLVLTMSPYCWNDLGMELTDLEKKCVAEIDSIPYPVAICDIENYPPQQDFVPSALKQEGLGHIGFIHTKDNRENPEEGRRCIIYMNLDPSQKDFSLDEGSAGRQVLLDDLKNLGYDKVTIKRTKVWDYNPILPIATSVELENQQGKNNTIYIGTYGHKSFENVGAAEDHAITTIANYCKQSSSYFSSCVTHLYRAYNFFTLPRQQPTTTYLNEEMTQKKTM